MASLATILQAVRVRYSLPPDGVFQSVAAAVEEHMAAYDASHDFHHVLRVTALSHTILMAESGAHDPTVVLLAALLHDVTDKKYTPTEDGSKLLEILASANISSDLSARVVEVVNNVSYSTEMRNPDRTRQVLTQHPELGIVQDADRLDAIGAVGIGRAFTYGAAKMPELSMQRSRDHISEKLVKLEGLMKTETGRRMARARTERLQLFSQWWDEECAL
ncbi:HD domain-containing protein [Aspergillus campestris IBT 28561]|uniref:HD domain-containing protein n=1 Tax=Aspergillus campestris (strain IBT 28561) TaxID=1392248 RepID=A0A2I1CXN7_ASPC2|nr:HD domain-containing protein [Aspergillus campestris IBT 28561]PKY02383.1 HD domain-containing protein [Aspergillus campestris IBT 28561]